MDQDQNQNETQNHAEAVLNGDEQPTIQDFIEWIAEEGVRMGILGFRTEYVDPNEIFAACCLMNDNDNNSNNNGSSTSTSNTVEGNFDGLKSLEEYVEVGMMGMHNEIAMMVKRVKIMKENRPLLARTEVHVDKELMAAGKSREEIEKYPNGEGRLRMKVVDLYHLKNPIPAVTGPPRGVDALVMPGGDLNRLVQVRLPVQASLAEVCELLDGTCAHEDYLTKGWHKAPDEKRKWKYQLVNNEQKTLGLPRSTPLVTDADYQHLIQLIMKKEAGKHVQSAILVPVSTSSCCKRLDDYLAKPQLRTCLPQKITPFKNR